MRSLLLLTAVFTVPALAQGVPLDPEPTETDAPAPPTARPTPPEARPAPTLQAIDTVRGPRRLGGPRTGITVLSAGAVDRINEAFNECYTFSCESDGPTVSESFPVVTQFGWQFETRMFQSSGGLTGLTEWVVLVGGADRGLFLPSLTFLAGVRAPGGFEVGVGPNLSLAGAAYAVTVGMNNEVGEVNVPLNLAVVLGQDGPRASILVGFTVSERRW